mmetsp:Transcript_131959/g.329150  ORF Transcript_131959/g.329150 Transcript_131959/m.329150 type:complete len:244 (-) Transcript_131959:1005-1736(-)
MRRRPIVTTRGMVDVIPMPRSVRGTTPITASNITGAREPTMLITALSTHRPAQRMALRRRRRVLTSHSHREDLTTRHHPQGTVRHRMGTARRHLAMVTRRHMAMVTRRTPDTKATLHRAIPRRPMGTTVAACQPHRRRHRAMAATRPTEGPAAAVAAVAEEARVEADPAAVVAAVTTGEAGVAVAREVASARRPLRVVEAMTIQGRFTSTCRLRRRIRGLRNCCHACMTARPSRRAAGFFSGG